MNAIIKNISALVIQLKNGSGTCMAKNISAVGHDNKKKTIVNMIAITIGKYDLS